MLQPNCQLSIPDPYSTAEIIYSCDDSPTATLTPKFRVVLGQNLANFTDLVGIGYLRSLHNALHNIFDDSTSWHFTTSFFDCGLPTTNSVNSGISTAVTVIVAVDGFSSWEISWFTGLSGDVELLDEKEIAQNKNRFF
ncbi:MAG: hypothetical protein KME21_26780 [Desmonostoc vinosum HA7617-LM4]|jgi:hypothetical protein|nr:hypothetical protein [Desmonostoc vinosum HA7617-LM4]